ncbi:MAG: PilZ domain-containing protein [Actinobacteria bacterium]|nr:PilZ domain-containing protein [Actinomycetota bacterium]
MALKLLGFTFKQSQKIIVKRSADDKLEFISSLENVNSLGMQIALPLHNLKPMPLLKGEKVYVLISLQSFSIEFNTLVKGFKKDNIQLVVLEFPGDYKRVQRRNAVRLKVLMDVEVALLPQKPDQEPVFEKGQAVDISAGGMEIITRLSAERDQTVLVKFNLELDRNRVHNFCIRSKVRRVSSITPKSKRLGVEFLDMGMADSDRIFQFIFKKSTTSIN